MCGVRWLVFVVCCVLLCVFVVCCLLFAGWLFVGRCLLVVVNLFGRGLLLVDYVRCVLVVVCCALCAVCCLLLVVCCLLFVVRVLVC